MMMESRRVLITDEDRGPIVNIATWIALVVMCIIVSMKTISRWATIHKLQRDDFYIIVAMLITVGQCIAAAEQVKSGLGRHISTLTSEQIDGFQMTTYISQILYAPSICGARVALLQFMLALAPDRLRRRLILGSMVFCMLWALIATLCVVLQCNTPRTWAIVFGQCFNQIGFWTANMIFDTLIDLEISVLPVVLLYDLQVPRSKKMYTMAAFAARILVIPCIILRFIYLSQSLRSSDRSYDDFKAAITTEIHLNFSVVVSCIPFLKPVMDSLQTGTLASNIHTAPYNNKSNRFPLNSFIRNRSKPVSQGTQTPIRRGSNDILYTQGWSVDVV